MRQGPFRIEKPSAIALEADDPGDAFRDYMNRLITLIPGEALGAYLVIRGFWGGTGGAADQASLFIGYLPILGLLLVIVARIWGTRDASGAAATVQPIGVFVAAIAFMLWVFAMGHSVAGYGVLDGRIASTLIVLFSFVVPYFYKGEGRA